jgi:hypothetical protein
MVIKQSHSDERRSIRRFDFHISQLAIPDNRRGVDIKHLDTAVGENPLSAI